MPKSSKWSLLSMSMLFGVLIVAAGLPINSNLGPTAVAAQTAPQSNSYEKKYRDFDQRPCKGIDDCIEANIAAEQTEISRQVNSISRRSKIKAIELLGPPTYVLRKGDWVTIMGYEDPRPTFADAIVGWSNGTCRSNELHVTTQGDQIFSTIMTNGATCTTDGTQFPLPMPRFRCDSGRRTDALCTLAGIMKLPEIAKEIARAKAAPPDSDPSFNAGRHFGTVKWADSNCAGHMDHKFAAAMDAFYRSKAPERFGKGSAYGFQEMQRSAADNGSDNACLTILFLYGPRGVNFAGAWVPQ